MLTTRVPCVITSIILYKLANCGNPCQARPSRSMRIDDSANESVDDPVNSIWKYKYRVARQQSQNFTNRCKCFRPGTFLLRSCLYVAIKLELNRERSRSRVHISRQYGRLRTAHGYATGSDGSVRKQSWLSGCPALPGLGGGADPSVIEPFPWQAPLASPRLWLAPLPRGKSTISHGPLSLLHTSLPQK